MRALFPFVLFTLISFFTQAQNNDTVRLRDIRVQPIKTMDGMGRIHHSREGVMYEGKKNEVLLIDSLNANKAINNTRQILGRIPGLVIVETESSGFTANGIATRGLNPSQSTEMNTRQNGFSVSADTYGYNEAYYLPPMEAVQRIEFVRGAAALQFGAHFGGMVNYVIREASAKPMEVYTSQTLGSYGLYNAFTSVSGTRGRWRFYSYLQYRQLQGYRANSGQTQWSAYAKAEYRWNPRWSSSLEYTLLRNRIQMPGGLTDSQFNANAQQSTRARNWLRSPWNIVAHSLTYTPSDKTFVTLKTSFLFSQRALVWRNEDGGPEAVDNIDPVTLQYSPREVERESMRNLTQELRFTHQYHWGKVRTEWAVGYRLSHSRFKRLGGGQGTTGSDFDLSTTGDWEYNFNYRTTNVAPFVEHAFRLGQRWSITPGARFEWLRTSVEGYKINEGDQQYIDATKTRTFPLLGLGVEYRYRPSVSMYANISQAYRPIDYSQLEPFGTAARIDSRLKDSRGYNADWGVRGHYKRFLNFDVGLFYMSYQNRIGIVLATDPVTGDYYALRTNVANSVHRGMESYVEWNILQTLRPRSAQQLNLFHSFSYTDARYVSGSYEGNRVEAAVQQVHRIGLTYTQSHLSTTLQWNYTGDAFGDATNAYTSTNPIGGYIPSYTVLDWSARIPLGTYSLRLGCNNLTDKAYFTRRTDEYPGPGILPAVGRSFYVGFTAQL